MMALLRLALSSQYFHPRRTFECLPAKPDDGKRYMQVGTFEECGKPGGVQEKIIPWSIVGILLLVVGYPAGLFFSLFSLRMTVMEDQIMRAARVPPLKETETAIVRAALGRSYQAFKPRYAPYWTIVIILRKFRCVPRRA